MGFKEWIIPQDKNFFKLLSDQSDVVFRVGEALSDMVHNPTDLDNKSIKIEELESEGDEIVHQMVELLNKTFVTPIDHDDLSKLTSRLDDIIDYIDAGAMRINSYQIKEIPRPMIDLVDTLQDQIGELREAIHSLSKMRGKNPLQEKCVEVNRLENVADDIVHSAVANLFKHDDIKLIIKLKEIYELFEEASDKCEDVADVIKDVAIKNA